MNAIFSNKARYCDSVQRVLLLSAVFLFTVLPARSQFPPPSQSKSNHPQLAEGRAVLRLRAGPSAQSKSIQVQLPEGAGKQIFQRACTLCHGAFQISRVNFDRQDWDQAVNTMVGWGAPLKKEEIPVVIDYMATSFNGEGRARGVVVPGSVEATIKEWDMPIRGSMPHDSIYSTRGGFTWVTQEFGQALGRFDPKTQQFKEYTMRPGADPETLVEDKQGNIWFATNLGGFIGKFDPKTGDVTEYTPPGPKLSFHDIAIDQKGIVWFCVLPARPPLYPDGSKIGRLNPSTGEIKLLNTPTRNAAPYGIVVNSKSIPFFTEFGSPRLGSVNPDTMEVTEYPTPNPETSTKRLAVTPDDVVWYTDPGRGYLGRFDPKTGKFSEWPTPSGPRGYPYGITHVGNIIWYSEAESNPNMLVRFDPKTEKFQTWPVKAGGGIKHVYAQPDGSLWLTRPLTNGIAQVTIKEK